MFRIALATSAIALGTFAQAQDVGPHFIAAWDLDGDGQVTLEEAAERRDIIFYTFDADNDGMLTPEEYDMFDEARANDREAHGGNAAGQGMGRNANPGEGMRREITDANGDGTVTRDEFMAAVPGWYQRMDHNGDGTVTAADFGPRG